MKAAVVTENTDSTAWGKSICRLILRFFIYWSMPLTLLLVWQGLSAFGVLHDYTMPSPGKVLQSSLELAADGTLFEHILASVARVLEGFGIAALLALVLGIAAGLFHRFELWTDFVFQLLKPIPPIAWIPLAILWFGIEETSKIYIIAIGAFFPIFVNTLHGIKNIDPKYLELARVYEVPRDEIIRKIIIPGALPFLMTGLRLGLASAWICVVAAEMIAATRGVGYMLMDARSLSRPDIVILGMLLIGIVGKIMDDAVRKLEKRLIRWN